MGSNVFRFSAARLLESLVSLLDALMCASYKLYVRFSTLFTDNLRLRMERGALRWVAQWLVGFFFLSDLYVKKGVKVS